MVLTHVRAQGLALSNDSTTLYIADTSHHQIKKVELSDTGSQFGNASAVCGQANTAGSANGIATSSTLNQPGDLAVTPDGTALLVADTGNHLVRKILLTSQGPAPQYSTYSLGYPGEAGFVDGRDNSTPRCRFDLDRRNQHQKCWFLRSIFLLAWPFTKMVAPSWWTGTQPKFA